MIEENKWEKEQNDLALLDEEFLSKLYEQEYHEKYARITSLTFDELPIARIEGKVTSGTINIDGSSNVRRTFNLTVAAHTVDINDYYWGIKTKVKLEIGLKNNLKNKENYTKYPEIIWFNQGKYVISTFNTQVATNGYTINISGKDKMCLLNGDLGGQLFASIDFGAEEQIKKFFKKVPITDTSIDTIMAGNYYFVPPDAQKPDIVSTKNELYEFQPINIEPPFYIKEGSNFRKVNSNNINIGNLQKYRIYKKVTAPDDILIPLEDAPTETTPPSDSIENNDILTETPEPSKPIEEPYVEEPEPEPSPIEPGSEPEPEVEQPKKAPKISRVTGNYPVTFTTDNAKDFEFDYGDLDNVATGVERSIGETWKWRTGQVDFWWPPGGYMSMIDYQKKHPEEGGENKYGW